MDSMIPMGQQMAVPKTSQTEMMISRQAQEVQGAIVMAKKFPRMNMMQWRESREHAREQL